MAVKCPDVYVVRRIPAMRESTTPPLGVVAPLDGDINTVRCRPNTLLKATPTPSRKKVKTGRRGLWNSGSYELLLPSWQLGVARVKTYGEVLREYESHLGAKSADAKGKPSGKQTVGVLHRHTCGWNEVSTSAKNPTGSKKSKRA